MKDCQQSMARPEQLPFNFSRKGKPLASENPEN